MKDLHPHANQLLAYADNALSPTERAEVDTLLANDKSAVIFLEQLNISNLPYKDVFDILLDHKNTQVPPTKIHAKWLWASSLVASLLLGVAITFFSLNAITENHNNWIVQVADYHLLYIRETVSHSHATPKEIISLTKSLSSQLNTPIIIPNLNAQKLDFRRGQILDSNGRKLVQLAYLPDSGRPVALCILNNNAKDALPKAGESRGLPYVTWSIDGLSYVIIGAIDIKTLKAAALSALSQLKVHT